MVSCGGKNYVNRKVQINNFTHNKIEKFELGLRHLKCTIKDLLKKKTELKIESHID